MARIGTLTTFVTTMMLATNLSLQAQQDQMNQGRNSSMLAMEAMSAGNSGGWYATGTSQVPSATPAYMLHGGAGSWGFMLQGVIFGVYTDQTGPRGRDKLFAPNWIMAMASRRLGPGLFTLHSMLSLEPVTITGKRYPLLFQTGELANGIPIINGQHPHDFFMELGISYQLPLARRTTLHFFAGPRGDPALGPPAYMHRPSASEDPVAALSHHYQDSTHIATDVITAGITFGPATIEASGFHGREPDEHRWGIEQGAIDSFSARATLTPTPRWAMQFSAGRINHREPLHPNGDSFRTTASAIYSRPFEGGHWSASLVWGRNHDLEFTQLPQILPLAQTTQPTEQVLSSALASDQPAPPRRDHIVTVPTQVPDFIYNSFLAESTLLLGRKHWLWGRVENVDRDTFLLYQEDPFVLFIDEQRYARVQEYTVGYGHELPSPSQWLSTSLGAQVMMFGVPEILKPIYGERPVGVQVFLRLRLRSPQR